MEQFSYITLHDYCTDPSPYSLMIYDTQTGNATVLFFYIPAIPAEGMPLLWGHRRQKKDRNCDPASRINSQNQNRTKI